MLKFILGNKTQPNFYFYFMTELIYSSSKFIYFNFLKSKISIIKKVKDAKFKQVKKI